MYRALKIILECKIVFLAFFVVLNQLSCTPTITYYPENYIWSVRSTDMMNLNADGYYAENQEKIWLYLKTRETDPGDYKEQFVLLSLMKDYSYYCNDTPAYICRLEHGIAIQTYNNPRLPEKITKLKMLHDGYFRNSN